MASISHHLNPCRALLVSMVVIVPSAGLLTAHGILEATDGVLDLARRLFGFAFGFQLGVAGRLTDSFFDRALGLFRRTRCDPYPYSSRLWK